MSRRRLRVLQVVPALWSGAGQVITSLCESLAATHEVAIVTSGRSKATADWPAYTRRLRQAGVEQTRIDFFDRRPEVFWPGVARLRTVLTRWKPDVVHAHAGTPACAALMAAGRDRRFALVGQVHSWGVHRPEWMDLMDEAAHRQADVVVCSSRAYERRLLGAGVARRRLVRIPWGLAPSTLPTSEFPVPASPVPRLGFVGCLEPRKGQRDLVRALARVRRRLPGVTLELVGRAADAGYTEQVVAEVARLGLRDAVVFCGHVENVEARVRTWDLFVSLSSDEGQGLAILEAMAAGVPVAARRVAGVEDYFSSRDGVVLPSSRPAAVAAALIDALADTEGLRVRALRARSRIRRAFNWHRCVRRIERVYARALAEVR